MSVKANIFQRPRKLRFGLLFAIVIGGVTVTLTVGSGLAVDQPTEAQILQALKAKRLTRCPQPSARSGCGGAPLQNPSGVRPSIDLEITFDYGSAALRPEAISTLLNLGGALAGRETKGTALLVAGHTDAMGTDAYNQDLSERRAAVVKRFLMERFRLRSGTLKTIGFGKTQLKNATDPFAGENRRVQIANTK